MVVNGEKIAGGIISRIGCKAENLRKRGIIPHLEVIMVGDNPASLSYIKRKKTAAAVAGIEVRITNFPEAVKDNELQKKINKLNHDPSVHALIIQRPLPPACPVKRETLATINPAKDVDGFIPGSLFRVPVVEAIFEILKTAYAVEGTDDAVNMNNLIKLLFQKSIVVIGRGETAGKPLARELTKLGIRYKVIHRLTQNPEALTKKADLIISCAGVPNIVRPLNIKPGVGLISVGLTKNHEGKLVGDYDTDGIKDLASFYTPTPGGVGPVNVACLLKNVIQATESITL